MLSCHAKVRNEHCFLVLCFNWKAGIFYLPYLSLSFRGVIWQEVCRFSASLEIHCPSHKGTLLGKERFYFPTSVVLKDNSLLDCVEWDCFSPSLCVGTGWSCREWWGVMILWGDHCSLGPFWKKNKFSMSIISNGFLLTWSMKGQRISWKFTCKHLEPNEC